jgi:hypothetical protein
MQYLQKSILIRADDWGDRTNHKDAAHHMFLQPIRLMSTVPSDSDQNKTPSSSTATNNNTQSLSTHQKAKQLISKYGTVFIGTYLGVYVTTLLSLFSALEYGILNVEMLSTLREAVPLPHVGLHIGVSDGFFDGVGDEVIDLVHQFVSSERIQEMKDEVKNNPHLSNLAIAWITVKFTEPLRLAASVMLCPKIAVLLGRRGDDGLRPSV